MCIGDLWLGITLSKFIKGVWGLLPLKRLYRFHLLHLRGKVGSKATVELWQVTMEIVTLCDETMAISDCVPPTNEALVNLYIRYAWATDALNFDKLVDKFQTVFL